MVITEKDWKNTNKALVRNLRISANKITPNKSMAETDEVVKQLKQEIKKYEKARKNYVFEITKAYMRSKGWFIF